MVKSSFEEKLAAASGAEQLKTAKQLLKNGALTCAWRMPDGRISAVFLDHNTYARAQVTPGDHGGVDCDLCGEMDGKLCAHAVAAIMYCGRFNQEIKPINDGESKYAGLKYEGLDTLAEKTPANPTAYLKLEALSAFPHVPSKWENAVFSVKLCGPERDYLGNLNNLRQLFFEKKLSIALKLNEFSLQDQQIIRFLAVNGEPDGSNILLNSEQTSELFHSLVGFDRFTRDGRTLYIRGDRCEPVILRTAGKKDVTLSPGLKVGTALLPICGAKVITGRSGCWIGRLGEYFFVPATVDVGWLRSFYRTGEQSLASGRISENMLQEGSFPLPIMDIDSITLRQAHPKVLLGAVFDHESQLFQLQVNYLYEDGVFPVDSGRIGRQEERCFLRDECAELMLERELEMFGFERNGRIFTLEDPETAGVFLDKVLPSWLENRGNICLEAPLAKLCCGGTGLPRAEFSCSAVKRTADGFLMHYELKAGSAPLNFRQMANAVKAGKVYADCGNGVLARIPESLGFFLRGATNAITALDEERHTFELPLHAMHYFRHLTAGLPDVCPPDLAEHEHTEAKPAPVEPPFSFAGDLRNYQREGVEWLRKMTDNLFNVILADEMGLGKTIQLLALLASRLTRGEDPAMVICPSSLVSNWEREAHKFVPDLRVAAMSGIDREEVWKHIDDYDLLILSYATARHDAAKLKKQHLSYLILDEAQHIKNPGTANSQNCKSIRATHRIVLTGTPLENSSEDLWSIMDFLHPGMLGSFAAFRKYYADIANDPALQQDLAARVSPFLLRRTKSQVGQELPPKQERTIFCTMDPEQTDLYEEIRAHGLAQLAKMSKGDQRAGTEIFTTLLRLRQICCHPGLLPENAGDKVTSAKFELLQEIVLEHLDSGHKLLLFSQFTSLLAKISEWLDEAGIPYEYLDGGTRNRQAHVDRFNNDPAIPLFLLSLKAGGTGLNLTSADTVVICDPWWNPAVELQAADRTHRIGQTRQVTMLKLLVKDSIEEKILAMQQQKQEIFDNVIENPGAVSGKFSLEELRFLLS